MQIFLALSVILFSIFVFSGSLYKLIHDYSSLFKNSWKDTIVEFLYLFGMAIGVLLFFVGMSFLLISTGLII